jgi:hypothetical protein
MGTTELLRRLSPQGKLRRGMYLGFAWVEWDLGHWGGQRLFETTDPDAVRLIAGLTDETLGVLADYLDEHGYEEPELPF